MFGFSVCNLCEFILDQADQDVGKFINEIHFIVYLIGESFRVEFDESLFYMGNPFCKC